MECKKSLRIPYRQREAEIKRTDNIMAKRKRAKRHTKVDKKLKIEKDEPH
jgi:hypothetical protein